MTQRCCWGFCQVMTFAKIQAVLLSLLAIFTFVYSFCPNEHFSLEVKIGAGVHFAVELVATVLVFVACKKYQELFMIPMMVYCVLAFLFLAAMSTLFVMYSLREHGKEITFYIAICSAVACSVILLFTSTFVRCFFYLREQRIRQELNNRKPQQTKQEKLEASYGPNAPRPQKIFGSIFFAVNSFVCYLIISDRDSRGHGYRKYLISLQLSSLLMDLFGNVYAPIFLVNCRLVFSESFQSNYIDISVYGALEVTLFGCVVTSYFACVYYRRNIVLPPGSRFCLVGWRRNILFLCLLMSSLMIAVACIVATNVTRGKIIPLVLSWVTSKPSFIFYYDSDYLLTTAAVTVIYYLSLSIICAVMVGQVLFELNHGLTHASVATKRYQKRAVVSLAFQGIVPKLMFLAPVIVEISLYINALSVELEEAAMNKTSSTISALVFSLITTHALVHSLTIVACSPAYRRTIRNLIRLPFRQALTGAITHRKSITVAHSTIKT